MRMCFGMFTAALDLMSTVPDEVPLEAWNTLGSTVTRTVAGVTPPGGEKCTPGIVVESEKGTCPPLTSEMTTVCVPVALSHVPLRNTRSSFDAVIRGRRSNDPTGRIVTPLS